MPAAWNRLAELELEYGIEKSKVDSVRSKLFAVLRAVDQERDRLRLLVKFRKGFILKQGWASVPLDGERELKELRLLYEYLPARILKMIE